MYTKENTNTVFYRNKNFTTSVEDGIDIVKGAYITPYAAEVLLEVSKFEVEPPKFSFNRLNYSIRN